jgi:hypothetical protein
MKEEGSVEINFSINGVHREWEDFGWRWEKDLMHGSLTQRERETVG